MKKKGYSGIVILITAGVLLILISTAQDYYLRNEMSDVLEKRAETELRLKGILIKNTLNLTEAVMRHHAYDISINLSNPDSVLPALKRMVALGRHLRGAGMAFVPNYYPSKGKLFLPYALKEGDTLVTSQIANEHHDYTQLSYYQEGIKLGEEGNFTKGYWTDPYVDKDGARTLVTTYSVPIRDQQNKVAGVVGIDMSLSDLADTLNRRHLYPSSFVLLLTEDGRPLILPSEKHASKEMTDSVINMINDSSVVREYSHSGHCKLIYFDTQRGGTVFYANMRGTPHWQIAVVCYDDEVYSTLDQSRTTSFLVWLAGLLLLAFILYRSMRNIRHLEDAHLEQERISSELRVASRIQMEMLPQQSLTYDERDDLSVCCSLEPAKEVGGDLFDHFLRDEKLFFCIADVSGKGVPSAMVMAVVHSLFRMASAHENNPAKIMQTINEVSCQNNNSNMFVTLFIGVLDLPTGRLRYCNAGHDVPIILKGQGAGEDGLESLPAKANLPVGVFSNFSYEMQSAMLTKGQTLFLYTDGLTEARNPQGELFRLSRVMETLKGCNGLSPTEIVAKMTDTIRHYMNGTPQSDDLTMMAIRYSPVEHNNVIHEELVLDNDVRQVTELNNFVKRVTSQLNMESSLAKSLRLAVEEAVVNAMSYAYPANMVGQITVCAMSDGGTLRFVISDSGVAFDPTETQKADTSLSANDRPIGGLGILLVRELMDSINYERVNGKNVLTLIKRL